MDGEFVVGITRVTLIRKCEAAGEKQSIWLKLHRELILVAKRSCCSIAVLTLLATSYKAAAVS